MAPSLDIFRGTQAMQCWRDLEMSQWWPSERILDLQNQRLRKLIKHAYNNVPYYRHLLDNLAVSPGSIQNNEDIKKLPFLDKQSVRNNFNELTATGFPPGQRIKIHTSGSTGQQLYFYTTKFQHVSLAFAERQRGYSSIGVELGDRSAVFNFRNQQRAGPVSLQKLIDALKKEMVLDVHEMIADKMRHIAGRLNQHQPKLMLGFPSIIHELARFIQINRQYRIRPKGIVTGGEQLFDYQREFFREVFGCETYNYYGTEEQHTIATECPLHTGYHLVAESVIVEIVDQRGEPAPTGQPGEVAITSLHNYAMPLIRYRLGDIGTLSDKACPCGRGLPILSSLSGRVYDSIVTKSGRTIPGQYLMGPLRAIYADLNLEEFQIVQDRRGQALIKAVPPKENSPTVDQIATAIAAGYRNILGEDLDVTVEVVPNILRSPSGKLKKVISNVHSEKNPEISSEA